MSYDYSGRDITLLAAEDLSDYQYRFVVQASDTTVQLANSADEIPVGILQNAPESGYEAVVRVDGVSKLVMNDAVAVASLVKNEYVGATDNGKGDAADTDGDYARGLVIQASGAEDDLGAVLLILSRISVP